jgi:hypothetical protein
MDILEHKVMVAYIRTWRESVRVTMHFMYGCVHKLNVSHNVLKVFHDKMEQMDTIARRLQLCVVRMHHIYTLYESARILINEMNHHLQ